MSNAHTPIEVFCSYAPEDESSFQQLQKHLRVLIHEERIVLWHHRLIIPGNDWAQAIDTQVNRASVILLLISADFLNSDYCYGIEMKRALERQSLKDACVIPILVRPVDWGNLPFKHLKVLPTDDKPISLWSNQDEALTDVAQGIRQAVEDLIHISTPVFPISSSKIWNIPYVRNRFFTGREELLKQLHMQLTKERDSDVSSTAIAALTQPQAIKGLGGMGKTQIAVEYAYRYHDRYPIALWVNAATEETLITSFVTIADILPSLPGKNETDQRKIVEAVKRWLEQCDERWLLVFDNADDIVLVRDFLPKTGKGHIVLTTCAHAVGSIAAASIEVEKMSLMEGSCLLLRRAYGLTHASNEEVFEYVSDENVNEAGNIVIALGALPLALDQAGAYIEETQCSLSHYLTLYQTHRKKLLARRGTESSNYPLTVETTWSLSFQKVEQTNSASAELLRLFAFLAPEAIPEELISDAVSRWSSPLRKAAADPFLLDQMIATLHKFSLVKRFEETKTLSIHRLVQVVLIDTMKQDVQRRWAERVVLAINDVFPDASDVALWPRCLRYLSQVQVCYKLMEQYMLMPVEAGSLLKQAGIYMSDHALYTIAEPILRRALAIYEQNLGTEHPDIAVSLNNLANLYSRQEKYSEAEPLYARALAIYEKHLDADPSGAAMSLNNLANLYRQRGEYEKAEPLYVRALAIYEHLGAEHPYTARSLNNLAELYRLQGKYSKAEPLYVRALSIREQNLGAEHPDIASSLNNLANFYGDQGKYEEEELVLKRVLSIYEQHLGTEHPDIAISLNNLAILYCKQRKYSDAEPLHQRALSIREQQLGAEHSETASSLNNLANLYANQGRYSEAERLYVRALAIYEKHFGQEFHHTAEILNCLATLYYRQGKHEQAELLLRRALSIYERRLGAEHPDLAMSLNNLANFYLRQGKYELVEPLSKRALSIYERHLGAEHPETAKCLNNLANLYLLQGKYNQAEASYQRALTIREKRLGPTHPETQNTRKNYATCLRLVQRNTEATTLETSHEPPTE